MHALAVTVDRNSPGRLDFQGAFNPESFHFAKLHNADRVKLAIGDAKPSRRRRMIELFESYAKAGARYDVVAFFMHGLRHSIPQFGWTTDNVGILADALSKVLSPSGVVALYACSTATGDEVDADRDGVNDVPGGEGGFADALRDALAARGFVGHVDAHERAGHTTCNPYVRRFEAKAPVVQGGEWLVDPATDSFRAWRSHLNEHEDLRLRFPLMTRDQIAKELEAWTSKQSSTPSETRA